MTVERKIVEQTIFYFTHGQVQAALFNAIKDQLPPNYYPSIRISAGLHADSGLTLRLQQDFKEYRK